ncbi:Polycomb protein Su(z)12 [Gracilariopsis chorda]|uniref:Polycomb protein Su(Z)12 n=1 Tax=Gracilariopsis chorda TaxID=448386 RepID=A0A2V3IXZ5_9FLOR|nr:Polycomb protein Su(z)12 [Gracilariopsis chorda]|eukprot:PXF46010.1 Polycomb protein Su(z)12 [Gracilariopsis chorda]
MKMALSTVNGGKFGPSAPPILPALLEIHRRGRPPFLVRTLKYVHEDRKRARRRLWDLGWTRPSYRSAPGARHLILTVRPSRCILRPGIRDKLFEAPREVRDAYTPLLARVRLCLCVRQQNGHYVSFSLRERSLRVWPAEDLFGKDLAPEDISAREAFDVSAVLPILSSEADALSIVVELAPDRGEMHDVSVDHEKLRGELVVWEKGSANGTVVPNGYVSVPLYVVTDKAIQPKQVVLERAVRQANPPLINSPAGQGAPKGLVGAGAASILLHLEGAPQHAISKFVNNHKPRVMVTLTYTSKKVPQWNGIVRHDFVCPWCHRNCYRYRTLLCHFQMEHDQMKFALMSLGPNKSAGSDEESDGLWDRQSVPFLVRFSVERIDQPCVRVIHAPSSSVPKRTRSSDGSVQLPEHVVYVNPDRYGSYMTNATTSAKADEQVREAIERISLRESRGLSEDLSAASTELYENRRRDLLSTVDEELSACCKHCQRPHDHSFKGNVNFCSDWCEATYMASPHLDIPLSDIASGRRRKRINFRQSLGHRKLFHVVTMAPVKEEHFDEDDPDSEDEVDQSWRGHLAIERVMALEDANTMETLWMVMWNKFAHEHFPLPGLYGDRFTRYGLELFAIENRAHIIRLKLRLKFIGFLHVLHVHGLIDSVAVLSIFQCLDGKKKRRDIALSSRPERSIVGGNGRGSRGRRNGNRV